MSKHKRYYNFGISNAKIKIKKYLNGQTPGEFIRRPEFERFVNGEGQFRYSTDQTLLNYWVRKSGMSHKSLDWRYNALFKAVKDDKLKDAYFIHFFLSANLPKKGAEIPEIIKRLDNVEFLSKIRGHR